MLQQSDRRQHYPTQHHQRHESNRKTSPARNRQRQHRHPDPRRHMNPNLQTVLEYRAPDRRHSAVNHPPQKPDHRIPPKNAPWIPYLRRTINPSRPLLINFNPQKYKKRPKRQCQQHGLLQNKGRKSTRYPRQQLLENAVIKRIMKRLQPRIRQTQWIRQSRSSHHQQQQQLESPI